MKMPTKLANLLAIIFGLLAVIFLWQFMAYQSISVNETLDTITFPAMKYALLFAVPLFIGFVSLTRQPFAGLLFFAFVTGIMSFLFVYTNAAWDGSAPQIRTAKVLRKEISYSHDRYGGTHLSGYLIYLQSWRDPTESIQREVTRNFYDTIQPGNMVQLTTKDGYRHFSWIVNCCQKIQKKHSAK